MTLSAFPFVIVSWALLLFAVERLFPATPWPAGGLPRLGRNLSFGVIAAIASPIFQYGIQLVSGSISPLFHLTDSLGLFVGIVLQLLLLDIWAYALHRAYHRIPLMWRLHGVHHLDEHLDVTSAIRFHIGEIALSSALRLIPLLTLGISIETNLLYGSILTICAMFHHSNINLPARFERFLSKIIVTPSIHWVHHHAVQRDTDSNYASILSVWDQLFGSASSTKRYRDMKIGVEGSDDMSLADLIVYPVKPISKRTRHSSI
jgi:sterol desaturase/sphingolipid hydroxylase (fatty acid hydroxylase superfamily)